MRDFVSPAAQQGRDIGAVNVRWGHQGTEDLSD
jgi:hypothetical protein